MATATGSSIRPVWCSMLSAGHHNVTKCALFSKGYHQVFQIQQSTTTGFWLGQSNQWSWCGLLATRDLKRWSKRKEKKWYMYSSVLANGYLQLQQLLKVFNPPFCSSFPSPITQIHTAGWGQRPGPLHRCTLGKVSKEALGWELEHTSLTQTDTNPCNN